QRFLRGQAGRQLVGPEHVDQPGRVGRGRDAVRRDLLHLRDRRDDLVKLGGQVVEFLVAEREPGKPGQGSDLVAGYRHAFHPRAAGVATRQRLTPPEGCWRYLPLLCVIVNHLEPSPRPGSAPYFIFGSACTVTVLLIQAMMTCEAAG